MAQNFTPIDTLIKQRGIDLSIDATPIMLSSPLPPAIVSNTEPKKIAHPAAPQISGSKEGAPAAPKTEILPVQEAVEKQEVEPEVQPFVAVKPQNISVPPELKKLGLKPIEKVRYKDFQNIYVPISDDLIVKGLKEPRTSGLRWLAEIAKYLLWQSHLKIMVVHGKVVRVLQK
ncbi:MAG: hypothetical protein ABIO02_02525 [Patescibacteria group bacterium]